MSNKGFLDACDFGFSPEAGGRENARALQGTIEQGGTIVVSQPGTYRLAATVYVGSHTTVVFANGVFIKKVKEPDEFSHVLVNKGGLTREYDENIV